LQMRAAAASGSSERSFRFHRSVSRMVCAPSVTSMLIGTVFSGRALGAEGERGWVFRG